MSNVQYSGFNMKESQKVRWSARILTIKNYLLLIPLLFMIIACSAGNNHSTTNSVQNIIKNINPPKSDCGLVSSTTGIANGCNVESHNPGNLGYWLSKSVVGIAVPISANQWYIGCTGTIIESRWVLTAAHCIANSTADYNRGKFNPYTKNLMVIPWQLAYNGVPNDIISESTDVIKFPVKAIYLPYHYNYYQESYISPYNNYIKDDFAFIELESALSNEYKPIPIETAPSYLPSNTQLWSAGYGINENQIQDGQLHYRKIYYYSNLYNTSLTAWTIGNQSESGPSLESGTNYGMIYTLGSIPESSESEPPAAWSFLGSGDSGGPLLRYNPDKKELSILAIYAGGLYSQSAGFYAQLPYPLAQYTAINDSRHSLTQQIMDKTASMTEIRCTSKNNACSPKTIYALNKGSNSITVYNSDNNYNLHYMQTISTGINPQAFTFDSDYDHILVANSGTTGTQSSISIFKIRLDGSLIPNIPPQQLPTPNNGMQISIISGRDDEIYTASNNIITQLVINHDSGILSAIKVINIPDSNINKIKFVANKIFAFDTPDNKIFQLTSSLSKFKTLTNNLNKPTDLIKKSDSFLITNSGDNQILNYATPSISINLTTINPYQIIDYNKFYYVTNLGSNNITILKFNKDTKQLDPIDTVATGNYPGNMAIAESQLFVTNYSDNTLQQYIVSPNDGSLSLCTTINTGQEPVAVLVTGKKPTYEIFD